jgi:hypothetical protein
MTIVFSIKKTHVGYLELCFKANYGVLMRENTPRLCSERWPLLQAVSRRPRLILPGAFRPQMGLSTPQTQSSISCISWEKTSPEKSDFRQKPILEWTLVIERNSVWSWNFSWRHTTSSSRCSESFRSPALVNHELWSTKGTKIWIFRHIGGSRNYQGLNILTWKLYRA